MAWWLFRGVWSPDKLLSKFNTFLNFILFFLKSPEILSRRMKSEVYTMYIQKNNSDVAVQWRSVSHGEVRHKGVGRDTELEEAIGGGCVSVDHHAGHRGDGVAGDDGGLDGELLYVRLVLLQVAAGAIGGKNILCSALVFSFLGSLYVSSMEDRKHISPDALLL